MAGKQPALDSSSIAKLAIQALGCGYDVVSDLRLSYCKGDLGARLIELDEKPSQDIVIPGGVVIPNVPAVINCDKGERMRFRSDVLPFHQMSEQVNQDLCISGKIPSGLFNAMFGFSGSWQRDASSTKSLVMDGWFITLYNVELPRSQLVLRGEVRKAVPSFWDPPALASFIEKYGTHIIVSIKIGGKDVICLKQHLSSPLSHVEVQKYLKKKADERFADAEGCTSLEYGERSDKSMLVEHDSWISQNASGLRLANPSSSVVSLGKDNVTLVYSRRGGDVTSQHLTHNEWLYTVPFNPDVISMAFVPITSLLSGVNGSGFLNHAVNLYLRYKPPIEELHLFLEFQLPRQWAPIFSELPLGPPRRERGAPSLHFSFMGPKLHVNVSPVSVGKRPVTGLRLYLEGKKSNRLAIHLQHLPTLPQILQPVWQNNAFAEESKWQGPEEFDARYFEPVLWKGFSHVCTAPVENSEIYIGDPAGACVVVGAQLDVKEVGMKNVLYLKLLYSKIPEFKIRRSEWDHTPATSQRSGFFSTFMSTTFSSMPPAPPKPAQVVINSGVFTGGPPVPVQVPKMLKYVDTTEMTKGPQDMPGHWLVTGAK
eukprot:c26007_g1_i1 orf=1-1785(-)